MALNDLQLAFLTGALGIAPSARAPAPAHGTAVPDSASRSPTTTRLGSPAQEVLSFAQGVGKGVADGGKALVKGVVHAVHAVSEEAVALAGNEAARQQAAQAVGHAVAVVGAAAHTLVSDPPAAASAVAEAAHKGIAAVSQATQGIKRAFEEAEAKGDGAQFLGHAVGEGAVFAAGALLTDGTSALAEGSAVAARGAELATEGGAIADAAAGSAALASTETLEGASTLSGAVSVERAATEEAAVAKQSIRIGSIAEYRAISSGELAPDTIYKFDGMEFETDHQGRSVATRGKIDPTRRGHRMPEVDRAIGQHPDADPFDVGFHRGADALGFPGGKLNVNPGNGFPDPERFPGRPNLNQGAYKRVEAKMLALAKVPGNNVEAEFKAVFEPGILSQRPDEFVVTYRVNGGKAHRHRFTNQPGG